MSTFFIVGSGVNNLSGAIQGANSTRTDYTDIKIGDKSQGKENEAAIGCDLTTITQTAAVPLSGAQSVDGRVGLDLGTTPTVGDTVSVISTNDIAGVYGVIDTSGDFALTEKTWYSCFDASGATYTLNTGIADPDLDTFVMRNHDDRLCGNGTVNSINLFSGYDSLVYANCWECFSGSLDPCDVTNTDITLWDDQAAADYGKVTIHTGGKVQAASIDTKAGLGTPTDDNPVGQNK